ncbi:hypothetical protein LSCM4_03559 [Leishmania orientalis]|uniref:Uncharacterized protein n=1 Tax=Leishmania orientalis TaxID=2249476 RepID=A0A836GX38_9TRYP|nr:hypothetical protein LSCM4_03559 [Leishmania orientalis]
MYASAAPNVPFRTASLPPPSPLPLPHPPAVFSAQQAEESIEFIQRELSRLLRACEYREQYPYVVSKGEEHNSSGAAARITSTSASHTHDPTAFSLSDAEPSFKLAQSATSSSFPPGPHRTDAAGAAATTSPMAASLCGASFSAFERRRIAHLLGRVALNIAAVWTYVHQGESLCGDSPAADTTSVLSVPTTAGRSIDIGTAAPASPPTSVSSTADGGRVGAATAVSLRNAEISATVPTEVRHSVWGEAAQERPDARNRDPAVRITALKALIETAAALRRSQEKAGGGGRDESAYPAEEAGAGTAGWASMRAPLEAEPAISQTFRNTPLGGVRESVQKAGDVSVDSYSARGSLGVAAPSVVAAASQSPPSPPTAGRTTASKGPEQNSGEGGATPFAARDRTTARRAQRSSSPVKQSSAAGSSIPFYLRAYVFEDGNERCGDKIGDSGDGSGVNSNEGDTAAPPNADRGLSRPISTGRVHTRSLSRASELLVIPQDDSYPTQPSSARSAMENAARASHLSAAATGSRPSLLGSAATSLTAPAYAGGNGGAAITVAALLDADPASNSSSLHIRRALSASSLPSASLTSSPLQGLQSSMHRSQGYSGGSASSQPNASVSHRSPDSAEVSPAAAAAYLRSRSLFRRPHRLEVPVSRTQSLRHAPSISSPVSVTGISLGSVPGVVHPCGALASASGAYGSSSAASSHMAKSSSGLQLNNGGAGNLRTSSYLASFPPVAMGTSATVDSPRSSVAELHFKRVVSLDSEGCLWPQGSLADSLEMSQQKMAPLLRRPSTSAFEATLSSPLPQQAGLATTTGSLTDQCGTFTSPSEGQPEGAIHAAASFSGRHSSARPSGRTEVSRSLSAQSRRGTLNPPVSSASTVAVSSALLGSSSSRLRQLSLLSPVHLNLSSQARAIAAVPTLTYLSPAPATAGDGFAADGPTPCLYHIEEDILTEFLRCVHDLRQANLTDAEFDSLQLRYFLPGVSLVTSSTTAGSQSSCPPPSAPPLPLFEGGELLPLHRGSLDVFCSLIRERLGVVCRHLRISTAPYVALL